MALDTSQNSVKSWDTNCKKFAAYRPHKEARSISREKCGKFVQFWKKEKLYEYHSYIQLTQEKGGNRDRVTKSEPKSAALE